ncbi:MAG: excisionase family DNA-binding protein [Rhodothermaceae bacterium]|nr:excisionase family DNA-binding protein [Rhodothermaceae bacterium]
MERRFDPSQISEDVLRELDTLMHSPQRPALVDKEGSRMELPEPIFNMLVQAISQLKQGNAVVMLPENETFTTQAAANYLGVSRQHFVNLLEGGKIPFHKVGSHRRVHLKDLLSYTKTRDKIRREALDALFEKIDKAGFYDSSYTGDES